MFARCNGNSAKVGIDAEYWRGLSVNRRLHTRKVSDLEQRIARPQDGQPCAIDLALFAFGNYLTARSRKSRIERWQRVIQSPLRHSLNLAAERHHRARSHHRTLYPSPVAVKHGGQGTIVTRADIHEAEVAFTRRLVNGKLAVNRAKLVEGRHRLTRRRQNCAHR